jgi:transcriptional regulator with XRE-family HTH domain
MEVSEIKGRLRAAGRTQADLARALGVTESHVSNLLKSKKRMALDTFRKIEAFLAEAETAGSSRGVAETSSLFERVPVKFVTLEEARKIGRTPRMSPAERERWFRELRELGEAGKRLPRITDMTADEILGYDEMK